VDASPEGSPVQVAVQRHRPGVTTPVGTGRDPRRTGERRPAQLLALYLLAVWLDRYWLDRARLHTLALVAGLGRLGRDLLHRSRVNPGEQLTDHRLGHPQPVGDHLLGHPLARPGPGLGDLPE